MTDFQAALGYRQILKYANNLKKRKQIAKRYIKNLKFSKGLNLQNIQKITLTLFFKYFVKIEILALKKNLNLLVLV